MDLLKEYDRLSIALFDVFQEIQLKIEAHVVLNTKEKKVYKKDKITVIAKVIGWMDGGDNEWDVNGEVIFGHDNMILEVYKTLQL